MRCGVLLALALLGAHEGNAQDEYVYKTVLVRAAPGRLLDLIETYRGRRAAWEEIGDEAPFVMRHSQGDQWDLLLLFPVGSLAQHYETNRVRRRAANDERRFRDRLDSLIAWQEEVFVAGPPLAVVREAFATHDFYHVEMFVGLPGRRDELRRQREMENAFLHAVRRPTNLIFQRVAGAAWDVYTVGFYRNIQHYAAPLSVNDTIAERAARSAGFEARSRIGTYLRTLISYHHDTLATAVR